MENQNNYELVPVLGLTVDAVSVPRAVEISQSYVENDYFNFILLAGAQLAMDSLESEETRQFVKSADLILPGDHDIEKAIAMNQEGHFLEEYIDQLLMTLAADHRKVCILCNNEEQCKKAESYLQHDYQGLEIKTLIFDKDSEEAMGALANSINGLLPDVIIPLVALDLQKKLLNAHRETLCAKLYLSSERIASQIFMEILDQDEENTIVKWLKKKLQLGSEGVSTDFWQRFDADVTE